MFNRSHVFILPLTLKRYEEAKAKGKDNYDKDLEDGLEKLVYECDRKIQRALKRLEEDDAKAATAIAVSEVTKVRGEFNGTSVDM